MAILARADRPCPKEAAWEIKLFRIDHSCDMAFPPVQGSSAAASRREIPTFGLPRRNAPPENPANWGHYVPGQAEAPANPAAPAAAGDWGSTWEDRRGRRDRGPAAHNPFRVQRPEFVRQMVVEEEDETRNSLLVIDNRDDRVVSPFQNWLAQEIMSNAASSINVLTERDQVLTPNSGYHCSLFANYTLDGIKAILLFSMTSTTGGPCAQWDSHASRALSHPAFQPFTWPVMFDTSATYVDVKVFNGNEVLFHWVFRGYRSDADLSVQQQFCDEVLIRTALKGWFRPSIVISVFVGWKVSVMSFEVGGQIYSIGPQGSVMASDYAMSTCELRVTERSSQEGYGNDADRVEFRFRDANNRLDLKCGRTSVPGTWLTVSHISGPALINTIQTCRSQRARVEGPDHVQQFAQLSAVIAPWYNDAIANEDEIVGTTTDYFPVERGNFHLRARSKLKVSPLTFVQQEALAHRSHNSENQVTARRGPPALMEEAAKQAVRQLGTSTAAALANMPSSAQQTYDQRVSVINPATEGEEVPADQAGDYLDEMRDRMRADMRFSRTSAAITPQVFSDVLHDREAAEYTRFSTVRVEETGPELPLESSTPSTAPQSFAPAFPPARTSGPYAMDPRASSRPGDVE